MGDHISQSNPKNQNELKKTQFFNLKNTPTNKKNAFFEAQEFLKNGINGLIMCGAQI